MVNVVYALTDIGGCVISGSPDVAIKDFFRSLPIFLSFLMTLWTLLMLHGLYRNVNEERRNKSILKNSICLIVFSGINILYIILGLIIGKYLSFVEGAPSPLYPLDAFLYSFVFLAIGILGLLYLKKWQEKRPFEAPSRGPIVTKCRWLYCIFMAFWMLIAIYSFIGGMLTIFIFDFSEGRAFFGIATVFMFLVNAFYMGVWEFLYNNLKEEKKKELLFPLSLLGIGVAVFVAFLFLLSYQLNLEAPSNGGFGMFPIAYGANTNLLILLITFTPLIVSVTALVKALIYRRKK